MQRARKGGALKRHMKVRQNINVTPTARSAHSYNICARECKTLTELDSRIRAAHISSFFTETALLKLISTDFNPVLI